ncbi:putative pectinesterase/pectinesterase inhibitor 36-like [Dorcoceras hygrometricum]|uniref:Pectinesterase n=1 Tax=Dorcoceras hygrometricum TaxID=472368 RepID=A0A2Z7CGI6_9LAMI|nr:putative pectinesterase/pectinesterase inhibitor 36-like [Dorcoceras hygrometricum]
MCPFSASAFLLLLLASAGVDVSCRKELQVVEMVREEMMHAIAGWADISRGSEDGRGLEVEGDCLKMYRDVEPRLARIVRDENCSHEDGVTWLSAALASHNSCMEEGLLSGARVAARNLSYLIREALAVYGNKKSPTGKKANAKDGSGNYKTINEAIDALAGMGDNRPERAIIYVKSGVYKEKVDIGRDLKNVMLVGDGMDKTVVTGNANVQDGHSTFSSATFGVSGDGFWARGLTFENTAGPQKHQAVALRASSDLAIFYQCSFKGYQDTLLVHSLRQFYRDCQIHGTIDFIFGDAAVVFQNCDIFVRRPMDHQSNMVTAQGRDDPNENTGISIVNSRVVPASDFSDVKGMFKSYLGRPWKKYSRTVVSKTDLDGMIDGKGWTEWDGDFALSTLYYGEYMNIGTGASTAARVKWPGFHALTDPSDASPFCVHNFVGGDSWIPASGVPYWSGI